MIRVERFQRYGSKNYLLHLSTLLTRPKTKDWQEELASHCAWQDAAVVIPVGCERGCWLPLPAGALPQVLRTWIGELETVARRAEAAMIVVKVCILMDN